MSIDAIYHQAIIYIETDAVEGLKRLKKAVEVSRRFSTSAKASSIYKHHEDQHESDARAVMGVVVVITTSLDAKALTGELKTVEDSGVEVTLLAFDQEVSLVPNLVLPHPSLHLNPMILQGSAEVYSRYVHPIYQKDLSQLSRELRNSTQEAVEFVAQGSSLIDF